MNDVVSRIVTLRRTDLDQKGASFGCDIPVVRTKKVLPFMTEKGVILEIKRASPSKGNIAPNLNAAECAAQYTASGAVAISVLTEQRFFKGSLTDMCSVCATVPETPVLRKDFLLEPEEIDVSYRCGADAILLIARILDEKKLLQMTERCQSFNMRALVEVRTIGDVEKLYSAYRVFPQTIVAGINARNLADFTIDPLVPLNMRAEIRKRMPDIPVIFESGIRSPEAVARTACLGFNGILAGEAAAQNPNGTAVLTVAFRRCAEGSAETPLSRYWTQYAQKNIGYKCIESEEATLPKPIRPFVKICGLCRAEDALLAAQLGADSLGFIFSSPSKRCTDSASVRTIRQLLKEEHAQGRIRSIPECVGVITDMESSKAQEAFTLVRESVLDVIQFHGCPMPAFDDAAYADIPRYAAVRIGSDDTGIVQFAELMQKGEARILADSYITGIPGGTGMHVPAEQIQKIRKWGNLWLAGGVNASNVAEICGLYSPERIDIASGVEKSPGIKDSEKMRALFSEIAQITREGQR